MVRVGHGSGRSSGATHAGGRQGRSPQHVVLPVSSGSRVAGPRAWSTTRFPTVRVAVQRRSQTLAVQVTRVVRTVAYGGSP